MIWEIKICQTSDKIILRHQFAWNLKNNADVKYKMAKWRFPKSKPLKKPLRGHCRIGLPEGKTSAMGHNLNENVLFKNNFLSTLINCSFSVHKAH